MAYRLMIVPGGNFIDIGNSFRPNTISNIHKAVQGGLNYLGVCAGGFLAGQAPYKSLNLTSCVRFEFYSIERRGIRKAPVVITMSRHRRSSTTGRMDRNSRAGVTSSRSIPTGRPPSSKECRARDGSFSPATVDNAYAAKLIDAALNGTTP